MHYLNIFKRLLLKKELNEMYFICFLMIINSFLEFISIGIFIPLVSLMMESNVDNVFVNKLSDLLLFFGLKLDIYSITIIIVSIYITKYLFLIFFTKKQAAFIHMFKSALSTRLFKHILSKNYKFHSITAESILIRNAKTEVQIFTNGFLVPVLSFILSFFITLFLISLLLIYNFYATFIILLVFSSIYILISKYYSKLLSDIGNIRQENDKYILKYLLQSLRGIVEVKILNLGKYYSEKFSIENEKLAQTLIKKSLYGVMPRIFFESTILLVTLFFIIFFAFNGMPLNELFAKILIYAVVVFRLLPSITGMARFEQKIRFALPAANTIYEFLKDKSFIDINNHQSEDFSFKSNIKLENISYKYDNKKIFENINFEIKKGEKVCILGRNGSGKSTLIKILAGLLNPNTGSVKIDNINLTNNLFKWYENLSYVPQEINLIEGSLIENISPGTDKKDIDFPKIKEAIEKAELTNFVEKTGLNKELNEFGQNLSGGEKQKIALARALYRNSSVILLDEATSAMDIKSVNNFLKNFSKNFSDKTVICITHKTDQLHIFDKVLDLNNFN